MFKIEIDSRLDKYKVSDNLSEIENIDFSNSLILIDSNVSMPKYLMQVKNVIQVVGDENLKTIESASQLLNEFATLGVNRDSHLIALGGGSVQDIATFISSIFMRGISWSFIPTTLMAMADSCIGGKSSLNVGKIKNIIGNFYPPKSVFIDYEFTESLNNSAIASGLFEGVKICFAKDVDLSTRFIQASNTWLSSRNSFDLARVIELSLNTKKWFIEIDEFDKKERKLLNFGHSFGHALESSSSMTIPHGLAIGIGMLVAMEFSNNIEPNLALFLTDTLKWSKFNFSEFSYDQNTFKLALSKDKKNSIHKQRLVLPSGNGTLHVKEFDLSEKTLEKQAEVLSEILEGLK